ncbi:hypothetical protein A2U01_0107092, partial [Trifolium medium]|nr:hypothetical protein [Trifolium medium]
RVDVVEEVVEDVFVEETPSPPLERVLVNSIDVLEDEGDREVEICLRQLESSRVDEDPQMEELVLNVQEKEVS